LNPQNVIGHSLRHNACFEPLCIKIHPRVTSVGESGEKIKKRGIIFHVFRQALFYGRLAQILGYMFVSGRNQFCKILS